MADNREMECGVCERETPDNWRDTWYEVHIRDQPEVRLVCPECWRWGPVSGRRGDYIEFDVGGYPIRLRDDMED